MDYKLGDDQQLYIDMVRKFVKNEITPKIMDLEKTHAFPINIIEKAWETGMLNLSIPESVKGYNIDDISAALIIRELSYGDTGISTSQTSSSRSTEQKINRMPFCYPLSKPP